jgi:hypothetical protein
MAFTPKTNEVFTGFGIHDVNIKKWATTDNWVDIPGVISASYKGSVSEVEQTGDDNVIDYWRYGQKGQITVKASKIAMKALERVTNTGDTGANVVSAADHQTISFGLDDDLMPPYITVRGVVRGRNATGQNIWMVVYWYKTMVKTAFESFPDGAYGKINELTLTFDVMQSTVDENNVALAEGKQSFGRIEVWTSEPDALTFD